MYLEETPEAQGEHVSLWTGERNWCTWRKPLRQRENMHVFGLGEETPETRESMQTTHTAGIEPSTPDV